MVDRIVPLLTADQQLIPLGDVLRITRTPLYPSSNCLEEHVDKSTDLELAEVVFTGTILYIMCFMKSRLDSIGRFAIKLLRWSQGRITKIQDGMNT